MGVAFIPVRNASDQERLARLAGQIWREYWPAHIGKAQTEYMVERFQSLEAIKRDMSENGYEYWFIVADEDEMDDGQVARAQWGRIVGFTGGHDEPQSNRFFVSKIYLLAEARGHHYATRTIGFYSALCHARGFRAMYLPVNKHNELAIRAYRGTGFDVIDSVETDIGEGFVMDDYIMEKQVRPVVEGS